MSDAGRVELAPGYTISRIISGCWQLSHGHGGGPASPREIESRLAQLVAAGFTTFDCADIYTGVEDLLGKFRRSLADPDILQIHTKFVPDRERLSSLRFDDVGTIVDRSLKRLSVERLDLVQFHWWDYDVPGHLDALEALVRLSESGKIRLVGITNFDSGHVSEMLDAGFRPASIQLQYSLLDRRPQNRLAGLCRGNDIALLAYGVLAGGLLGDQFRGAAPPATPNRSLQKYLLIVEEAGGWENLQKLVATLGEVAARHDVSPAAVACRWMLDQPGVAAVILGTGTKPRIDENLSALELQLADEDRADIDGVLGMLRVPPGDVYELERDPDGPHRRLIKMNLNRED